MSNYNEKITRLSEMENILIHYTTPNNALFSLSNGLFTLNELSKKGIFPELDGFHNGDISLCPDRISFFKIKNPIREGVSPYSLEGKTTLIIDEKYFPYTEEFVSPWGIKHPVLVGQIPPEDILAILVEENHMTPQQYNLIDRLLEIGTNFLERMVGKSSFKCPDYKHPPVKVSEYLNKHQQEIDPSKKIPIYVFDNNSNERPIPVSLHYPM